RRRGRGRGLRGLRRRRRRGGDRRAPSGSSSPRAGHSGGERSLRPAGRSARLRGGDGPESPRDGRVIGGPLLTPLAVAYGIGVRARLALYRRGLLAVRRAGRPVVSIGNIAAGGTGKTPFLRWLTGALIARGQRPSILTRGYGRRSRGTVVVSDGAGGRAGVA